MDRQKVARELVKVAKELTAKKVEISNRLHNRAMNRGAELMVPWPERALGEYGSGDASDRDMDRWVADNVEMPEYPVVVTGVGAGRTNRGDPVIIVHLGTDPSGWKTEDGVMYPGSRSDAVGRKLPREVQASDTRTANQEKAWQMLTGNKIDRIFNDISYQAKDLEIVLSNIQTDARRAEGVSGETDAEEWLSQLHDEVESFAKFVNKVENQIAKALR